MSFEEGNSALECRYRFCIRVDMACNLASVLVVGNGPYRQTCMLIMGCDLSADRIQIYLSPRRVVCIDLYESFSHTTMEEALVCGTQGSISQLSEFVVAKVIGLSRSRALYTHHAPLPEFIQPSHHCIFTFSTGSRKHGESELAPDDRRHVCEFAGKRGELREPCSKHGLYGWRKR